MGILIRDVSITPQTVKAGSAYLIFIDAVCLDYNYYAGFTYGYLTAKTYKEILDGKQ